MENQRYGMLFTTNNKNTYYYDTATGKVAKTSHEEAMIIQEILENKISLESTFKRNKGFENFVKKENLFKLQEKVPFNIPSVGSLRQFLNGQCAQIILELTEVCNLRCGYCIYNKHHPNHRGYGTRNMPFEIAKRSLDMVLKDYKRESFFLTFYGGEPLANFNLMKQCIEYVKREYNSIQIAVSFTTNLTLLNTEMIKYFNYLAGENIRVSIMCSIDGPKDIHDRYRRFENGDGSFDIVIEKFKRLMQEFYEEGNEFKVLSINGVITPPCEEEKIELLKSFYEDELCLPSSIKYEMGYVDQGDMAFDFDKNEKIAEDEIENVVITQWATNAIFKIDEDALEDKDFNLLINSISRIAKREKHPNGEYTRKSLHGNCIPGQRRLYVTVDGEFKPCERVGKCPSIGNYKNGMDVQSIYEHYIKNYALFYEEKCRLCWAQNLCNACYTRNMGEYGVEEKENFCDEIKDECYRSFVNYYDLFENRNSMLKTLVERIEVLT